MIDRRKRLLLRANSVLTGLAVLAVLALAAWLSARYPLAADWSTSGRGELHEASRDVLERLDGGVELTAFVRPDSPLAQHARRLAQRYQRHAPRLRYRAVNPGARSDLVERFGIDRQGQLVVSYQGRHERVAVPSESRVTEALAELLAAGDGRVAFAMGFGERDLQGEANADLGRFGDHLKEQGYSLKRVDDLAAGVPSDSDLLVIADPRLEWPRGQQEAVTEWLDQGGNLLWLADSGDGDRMGFLADTLGVRLPQGRVVEPRAEAMLGVDDSRLLALAEYPEHAALEGLGAVSLLSGVRVVEPGDHPGEWASQVLLRSAERHWRDRSADSDDPAFSGDDGDERGPMPLGVTLSRATDAGGEQRVAVVGDADFLANAYLGNGANQDLGTRVVDWLTRGARVSVPEIVPPDQHLELDRAGVVILGGVFLVGLPALFLAGSLWTWWRRRRG
ncbi:MAG: DUF4350 domain-containing protein [Ectothiorhodospiraceae bacterium]